MSDNTPLEDESDWPPWESDAPNDAKSGEGCVQSNYQGLWKTVDCSEQRVCLCEARGKLS